jgi:DNA polymerase-3 subunit delta'
VRVLTTPEGKRRIPIESVREAERWLAVGPHEGLAKVLVIEPADLMTEPAANALLKTLEEPRAGSYLVLVTAAPTAMIPTVLSRCQAVRFRPLRPDTVEALLADGGMEPGTARLVAALSGGSMARAASYSDERLEQRIETVTVLLAAGLASTPDEAMTAIADLKGDRDEVMAVLELALLVLQEVLWLGSGEDPGAAADSPLFQRTGQRLVPLLSRATVAGTSSGVAAANRALTAMRRNNMNPQLALEGMVASIRGHRVAGEAWSRIGAR